MPRWLRPLLRLMALAMAGVHTAVAVMQQSMNADGINYLDMGDAYLSGDWAAALNGVWSPVYAWLLASSVRSFEPSIWWEFPTVQLTNFAIYCVALLCFEFFWRRLTRRHYDRHSMRAGVVGFPPVGWLILGYSLFIWSSLDLINIWSVTPDLCVAAVVYVAGGLVLRAPGRSTTMQWAVGLGLLLGFGYLVKAALLPLGIVCLVLAAMAAAGPLRQRAAALGVSLAAMALVAAPLIVALSWSSGRFTVGDVGRFTYMKHVNELAYPDFLASLDRVAGAPLNPPRRIFEVPPVYEFTSPIAGTYPMAYNPGYWTAGLEPVVSPRAQARALMTSVMSYFDLFVRQQGGFLAIVLLLWFMRDREGLRRIHLDGEVVLVLWSLAAFGMYAIVHVQPRYIAPFVVLLWAGVLGRLSFSPDPGGRRLAMVGGALLAGFVWVNLAASNLDGVRRVVGLTPLSESASQPAFAVAVARRNASHPEIAHALLQVGLRNGDPVGFIGYSYTEAWARLARLRIVAEIHWHDKDRFWHAPAAVKAEVIRAFAGTGAAALIAEPLATGEVPAGWQGVGDTGYLIYWLR